jgi:putative ABC transport system substrate-binding protein
MDRRAFLVALIVVNGCGPNEAPKVAANGSLATKAETPAQPATRVYRIGVLSIGTDPGTVGRWQVFYDALRDLNYVEGRNLVLLPGFGGGNFERVPGFVSEFVNAGVDVIVATGTREIRAAKQATASIPIVMILAADPVKEGFVASLARPGGNVTGLTSLVPGLPQKYVELMHEVVPTAKRFAVVNVAPNPIPEIRRELEEAGRKRGLSIIVLQAADATDFDRVMAEARREGAAGIIHPIDGGTSPYRPALVQAALKNRLPGIYWDAAYVDAGGLMTYSINVEAQYRRAAAVVDRILRGAKPADLPVELPVRVETVVNLKTAKALGITIPQSLLIRTDRVID